MSKNNSSGHSMWLVKIFIITFLLSIVFNYMSTAVVENLSIAVSIIILVLVILIGVLSDLVATAVTAADEAPFHAKAADKKRGAKQAVFFIKNADRVSNVCGDVIGDICGVLSGATSALIAVNIANAMSLEDITIVTMLMTAVVTAFTVLGKGIGKHLGIKYSSKIVNIIGVVMSYIPLINKKS